MCREVCQTEILGYSNEYCHIKDLLMFHMLSIWSRLKFIEVSAHAKIGSVAYVCLATYKLGPINLKKYTV